MKQINKILLIEDDDEIRTNVDQILETHGYSVFSTTNGKDGIKLAIELIPNLILCDIMMPIIDGYGVLEALSNHEITKQIPFIFLTAKAEISDIRTGMNLGADDYIVKPFRAHDLLSAVKKRLERVQEFTTSSEKTTSRPPAKIQEKILLTVNDKPVFIKIPDIKYITAHGEYTEVFHEDGTKYFVRKLLKTWEDALPESDFLRIHRSTIVNLNFITKAEKWFQRSLIVFLKDVEKPFEVSQRYTIKIRNKFSL